MRPNWPWCLSDDPRTDPPSRRGHRVNRVTLAACLAVGFLWALAVFVRVELEAMARRAWHRIACAWMQCDEARG